MNRRWLTPAAVTVAGFVLGAISAFEQNAAVPVGESSVPKERASGNGKTAPPQEVALGVALSALRASTDLRELAALGSALDQLGPAQVRALLDHLERENSSPMDDRLAWLFGWWLKRDPAAAAEWIQPRLQAAAQDGPLGHFFAVSSRGKLITAWAKASPGAALEFARRHPRTGLAGELLASAIEAWPERDDARRLALLLAFPAGNARSRTLESFLSHWAQREPHAALAAAQALAGAADREKTTAAVLRAWADHDAAAAFAQYRALALAEPALLSDLLRGVASENPAQAVEWLTQLDGVQLARCAPEVVQKWAERDPAAAFTWALAHGVSIASRVEYQVRIEHDSLGRSHSSTSSSVNPLETALAKHPEAMLAWLRGLPPGTERDRLTELATAASRDVDQALALFSALPPDAASRAARQVGARFYKDPERGREWAMSLPPGPVRREAWAGLGEVATKPLALPPGADRDAMLSGMVFAQGTARSDVTSLETALEIGDPVLRRDMLDAAMEVATHVSTGWEDQARAARVWLEKADVPEEWKRRWRK